MANELDEVGHGRAGALAALKEAADNANLLKFGTAVDSFETEDYEQIIGLAWTHQFDADRSKFKRELRPIQAHVSERILARLELHE